MCDKQYPKNSAVVVVVVVVVLVVLVVVVIVVMVVLLVESAPAVMICLYVYFQGQVMNRL
jgi:hypothetical protein